MGWLGFVQLALLVKRSDTMPQKNSWLRPVSVQRTIFVGHAEIRCHQEFHLKHCITFPFGFFEFSSFAGAKSRVSVCLFPRRKRWFPKPARDIRRVACVNTGLVLLLYGTAKNCIVKSQPSSSATTQSTSPRVETSARYESVKDVRVPCPP